MAEKRRRVMWMDVMMDEVEEEEVANMIREEHEGEEMVEGQNHQARYRGIMKRMSKKEKKRVNIFNSEFKMFTKRNEELEKVKSEDKKRKFEEEEEITYTLMVQGRPLSCSEKTIKCSSLFTDLLQMSDQQGPIPVPDFISRQIMLDLVEMVEKGNKECAHLVLVSLSYLLDFLIAVDYLRCFDVKTAIEDIIKHQIAETNWRDVFNYTKDIMGLYNTTCHAVEFVCKRLRDGMPRREKPKEKAAAGVKEKVAVYCNQSALMEGKEEGFDPYEEDYTNLTAQYFKVIMRSAHLLSTFKFFLLKKWRNCNKENKEDLPSLICALPYKSMGDSTVSDIKKEISEWDMNEEGRDRVEAVMEEARKEKEREQEEKKETDKAYKLARRGGHFLHHGMMMEFPFDGMENLLIHF